MESKSPASLPATGWDNVSAIDGLLTENLVGGGSMARAAGRLEKSKGRHRSRRRPWISRALNARSVPVNRAGDGDHDVARERGGDAHRLGGSGSTVHQADLGNGNSRRSGSAQSMENRLRAQVGSEFCYGVTVLAIG